MEATGWKFLPFPGGLLDQPQWLFEDLFAIAGISSQVRKKVRGY